MSKEFSSMIYFLMAVGLFASLFADDFSLITSMENDPSSIVAGRVSVITGDPIIFEEDLIIQGVEPIRITRAYVNGDWCSIHCITPSVPMDMDWYIKKNPSLLRKIFDDFADVLPLLQKDGFSGFNKDHFFLSRTYQEGIKKFISPAYEEYGGTR